MHPIHRTVDQLRIRINAGQRRNCAHEHRHGMGRIAETLHEFLRGFMQHGVMCDVVNPVFQFRLGRQLAEHQQIRDLEKRAAFRQNLNGIAAIAQNSLIPVDVGDAALAGCRVHERRIVGHQPKVVGSGLDLAQIHRPNRSLVHRDGVRLVRAIVGDREGVGRGMSVLCHGNYSALSACDEVVHSRV